MERVLTDNERFAIAYALKKQAAKLRRQKDRILSSNELFEDDEKPILNETRLRQAEMYHAAAQGNSNLADFILRNKTVVHCSVLIPEQL